MQEIKSVLLIFTLVLATGTSSCVFFPWKTIFQSISPDGRFVLSVWEQAMGPDSSVRISLSDGKNRSEKILYSPRGDRAPSVCEVTWLADPQRVGVLICDNITNRVVFAFDIAHSVEIPSRSVINDLRNTLRRRYSLSEEQLTEYGGDPLNWACGRNGDAESRFHEMLKYSQGRK